MDSNNLQSKKILSDFLSFTSDLMDSQHFIKRNLKLGYQILPLQLSNNYTSQITLENEGIQLYSTHEERMELLTMSEDLCKSRLSDL